jgi:anti-sigma factor RsiW
MKACRYYEVLISERLSGRCSPQEERELEAHLQECGPCRRTADGLARTRELLPALPARDTSPDFMRHLHGRLASVRQPPLWVRRGRALLTDLADAVLRPRHVWQPVAVAALVVIMIAGAFATGHHALLGPETPTAVAGQPLDAAYFDQAHEGFRGAQPFAVDAGWRLAGYEVGH